MAFFYILFIYITIHIIPFPKNNVDYKLRGHGEGAKIHQNSSGYVSLSHLENVTRMCTCSAAAARDRNNLQDAHKLDHSGG